MGKKNDKYSLVCIDGNAFSVMGYVRNAMRSSNFSKQEIDSYIKEAMRSDYNHLIVTSLNYIDKCNRRI